MSTVNSKCKICRRANAKLFLKGDRCLSVKCAMVKKPYPPGPKKKKRPKAPSEYGKELTEKQKLRNWYNLGERQFRKYVEEILEKRGRVADTGDELIKKLETRLDNVVFRLGFAGSRNKSRQMVNHGHFTINGRKNDIPSCQVKKGDIINVRAGSVAKKLFVDLKPILKKHKPPTWLSLDAEKMEGKIIGEPSFEEASPPAEISAIFEFYSR